MSGDREPAASPAVPIGGQPRAAPEASPTWQKYSSEMRAAHSMHCSRGRQGLDTSAHLISIRLIRARFSGVLRAVSMASWSSSVF